MAMRIVGKIRLCEFWEQHPNTKQSLLAWFREVRQAEWDMPAKLAACYPNVSIIAGNRVVFSVNGINGSDCRLVAKINYPHRVVSVRFVGTHTEYHSAYDEEG